MAFALRAPPHDELLTLRPDGTESRTRIFRELAVVRLKRDLPALEGGMVRAGTVGTIVFIHGGGVAYDVDINAEEKLVSAYSGDLELV